MNKRGVTSNTPPPQPPSKNQNPDFSCKSAKKTSKKPKANGPSGSAVILPSQLKIEKRRKSDQLLKKPGKPDHHPHLPDGKKARRASAEPKKKKEKDSFEESKRNAKKPKKKVKGIDLKKLKEDEEASDRKKGSGPGSGNSSRRQVAPANAAPPPPKLPSRRKEHADGSDRHVRPNPPPDHSPAAAPPPKNNNSDKQLKGSDQKPPPQRRSMRLTPGKEAEGPNNDAKPVPPVVVVVAVAAAPAAGAATPAPEESEEEDEESSGAKTPPNKDEPNEAGSEVEPEATDTGKDFAAKAETFAVGGLKITSPEVLKGSYGFGSVILKEIDKKIEGYSVGAHLTIKFERNGVKLRRLFMEIEILKFAHTNQKSGVPHFLEAGEHGAFQCLVIDGLGPSLAETHDKMNGFSASTTFRIALITLDILRSFHSMLYVHRDIRPQSFYLGKDSASRNKIVLGQMGFAKKCGFLKEIEPEEKCELEMKKPKYKTKILRPRRKVAFLGSVRYAPRSSHLHKEHTRRDDMESWFFMIYELINKTLPWKSVIKKEEILVLKETFIMDQKFSDEIAKKYGNEISNICEYFGVQNFHEMEPDYNYFELSILNLMKDANKLGGDNKFDWETSPNVFERTGVAASIVEESKKPRSKRL